MNSPRDEHLMLAVAKGDLCAFNEIMFRYQGSVWSIAYRFLGDAIEAEDIAQETFLKILEAAPKYRPTASFRTYLYRVVTNLCIDHVKKKRPIFTDNLPEFRDQSTDPAQLLTAKERGIAVRNALDVLPANQRIAIILRHYEGLSYADIAQAMKTSVKAVEGLIRRARTALQTRLAQLKKD